MQVVEIRDLDGPNLFALHPLIKIEIIVRADETVSSAVRASVLDRLGISVSEDPTDALKVTIAELHRRAGLPVPRVTTHQQDLEEHVAICFSWEWRSTALAIAEIAVDLISGTNPDQQIEHLPELIAKDELDQDTPTWVRDAERRIPTVAITGTNGKTTTTRLLAHIARQAGYSVGWSSSSGVYINGEQVIDGDYTGHGGARRVLLDPDVDVGILETARGGILQRGLGFESSDVGVFLNVSADHLHLHGVTRLETLARVKGIVVRTTRPEGVVVLNAEDPLVLVQQGDVRAEVVLISQDPENPAIQSHRERGGRVVVRKDDSIWFGAGRSWTKFIDLVDVPLTYGGAARHMVENVLAACAASIGLAIGNAVLSDALLSFHPDVEHNAGRLNVFELDGRVIVVDFAHNESGLRALLDFARDVFHDSQVTAVIGTAGDREDSVFVRLGQIAGERADHIIVKRNPRYLRGRELDETVALMLSGIERAGASAKLCGNYPNEFDAAFGALESSSPGDVVVMMCVEDYKEIIQALRERGAVERIATPS